jgi:hypothetical protein
MGTVPLGGKAAPKSPQSLRIPLFGEAPASGVVERPSRAVISGVSVG